jgi:hypothetical protein
MRSHETSKLLLCCAGAVHDESQSDESEGQVFCWESEDVDCYVCVRIVLGESVCESED